MNQLIQRRQQARLFLDRWPVSATLDTLTIRYFNPGPYLTNRFRHCRGRNPCCCDHELLTAPTQRLSDCASQDPSLTLIEMRHHRLEQHHRFRVTQLHPPNTTIRVLSCGGPLRHPSSAWHNTSRCGPPHPRLHPAHASPQQGRTTQ